MTNMRLCNANQLELHPIINPKFPRRFSVVNSADRTAGYTREKFEADDERTNLHDKRSRDSTASLSYSQRRRRRFRGDDSRGDIVRIPRGARHSPTIAASSAEESRSEKLQKLRAKLHEPILLPVNIKTQ